MLDDTYKLGLYFVFFAYIDQSFLPLIYSIGPPPYIDFIKSLSIVQEKWLLIDKIVILTYNNFMVIIW